MPAIKPHTTDTVDTAWDGPQMKTNLKTGQDESYYRKAYAWQDPEGDPTTKAAYKFIHHMVDADGNIGAANINGCRTGISVLNGAMGGTTIPKEDYQGVYDHLAKHIRDAGETPPELNRSLGNQKEVRFLSTNIEIRTTGEDNQQEVIEGYALKFNKWSDVLGFWVPFREKIDSHALDNCDMSNVVATFNHDESMPLARNTVKEGKGSLQLTVDNIGLHFRFIPTDTSYAKDLKENIRAGVINQCSFAFTLADDENADTIEWNEQDGIYERTLNKIGKLYDIAIVTTPAYPDTEAVIGARAREKVQQLEQKRKAKESSKQYTDIEVKKKKLTLLEKSV